MRADFPVSGENVYEVDKRGLEVDSPSGEDGGRETRREIFSPPVFLLRKNPAPSSEGALCAFVTASAVVGRYTQAKDNSMSL